MAPPAAPAGAVARPRWPPRRPGRARPRARSWSRLGLPLADRAQQAVALLEGPAVRGRVRGVAAGRGARSARRAAARRSDGGPMTRSISSGAKSTVRRCSRQRGRTPRYAVDLDLLATADLERQLQVGAPAGRQRSVQFSGGPADHTVHADEGLRPTGSARHRSWSGGSAPARAGRRLPARSSYRRRWVPRRAAARDRTRHPARHSPGDSGWPGIEGASPVCGSGRRNERRGSAAPTWSSRLRGRLDRHHDVDVLGVADRSEDTR